VFVRHGLSPSSVEGGEFVGGEPLGKGDICGGGGGPHLIRY